MLEAQVKKIICEHLGVPADQVTPDAHLNEDLGADSLDAADLLLAINETFGIRITPEALEPVHTVSQLVALVESESTKKKR